MMDFNLDGLFWLLGFGAWLGAGAIVLLWLYAPLWVAIVFTVLGVLPVAAGVGALICMVFDR